jgi:hypothetical protein
MIPYKNRRLTTWPDIDDIHTEGRNTSTGSKDYLRNRRKKAATRRYLKHVDKQMAQQEINEDLQTTTNT